MSKVFAHAHTLCHTYGPLKERGGERTAPQANISAGTLQRTHVASQGARGSHPRNNLHAHVASYGSRTVQRACSARALRTVQREEVTI